jgi:hypothetical protein
VEEAKKDMDQLGFESKAFEALERDFQEVRTPPPMAGTAARGAGRELRVGRATSPRRRCHNWVLFGC